MVAAESESCIPKLFLTSSGAINERLRSAFQDVYRQAQQSTGHSKLIYVPDALQLGTESEAEQSARLLGRQLGLDPSLIEIVWGANRPADSAGGALDGAAAVYVEQGNTYYVTYQIRRTGLDEAIQRLVARGGLYAGASAGAILAGATLRICEWKNWDDPGHGTHWDLRETKWGLDGLSLIQNGASIFPHAGPQWEELIQRMRPKHQEPVIILDEEHCWVQDDSGGRLV